MGKFEQVRECVSVDGQWPRAVYEEATRFLKARKIGGQMSGNWSIWVPDEEMKRRAAGRTHYNSWRRDMALLRRRKLADAYVQALRSRNGWSVRGFQKQAARSFGVSEATISRDMQKIRTGDWSL